ncbi:alkaline phosphatase family protein [Halobaculum gomorrense]|uniref:Sulfatase n=1 Tax=Halobaculum gomorrense TaxID=43928 RepID=A0A1M5M2A6_9EURY|nr:hypothetical protein [Halobaculum gomorrense]SHG71366.1 hypothetical protein SAMN05443636_0860 [Halobaculum gomorrense]
MNRSQRRLPDIGGFLRETATTVRREGVAGLSVPARAFYHKLLQQGSRITPPGRSIYEKDWDVLVVLDACRYDLFAAAVSSPDTDFAFVDRGSLAATRSVESATRPWMRRTFGPGVEGVEQTHYVVGSPWSSLQLDESWFASLDPVWQDAWDDDHGTLLPETVTDRALAASREVDFDAGERLLVHYMQPHCPFIDSPDIATPKAADGFTDAAERDVWTRLQAGEVSLDEVRDGYRANLDLALVEVERLLHGIDSERVIITSDHGNATGEYGLYGHPESMPFDCLREVPWFETTAIDTGERPSSGRVRSDPTSAEPTDDDIETRLRALGYR